MLTNKLTPFCNQVVFQVAKN